MSVQEIEKAITQLRGDELNQLLKWIETYQSEAQHVPGDYRSAAMGDLALKPLPRFAGETPTGWKEALYGE
jgi:hypothetical protein